MNLKPSTLASSHMTVPTIFSLVFHAIIVAIAIVGLPHVKPTIEIESTPVTVEIFEIDEFTQMDKPLAPSPNPQKKPDQKQTPPSESERDVAPKVTAKAPPKAILPEAPEDKPSDNDKGQNLTRLMPVPGIKPFIKKPPIPDKVDKNVDAKKQEAAFESVLKNLTPDAPDKRMTAGDNEPVKPERPSLLSRFGDKLTMSEQDALRRQLSECWKLMAGARYAEDLIVELKLFMNQDGTLRQASIIDTARYNRDNFFRAAADSAFRAVNSPQCTPFSLPPEKYDAWKVIIVRFDPRDIL